MATRFEIKHEFKTISLDIFEKYLNHPKLDSYLKSIKGFETRELVNYKKYDDGKQEWIFLVKALSEMPSYMKSLFSGHSLGWHEHSRFEPNDHCIYWRIEPLIGKNMISGQGRFLMQKKNKGTLRTIDGEVHIKVPLLGSQMERFLVNELIKAYDEEPKAQLAFYEHMIKQEALDKKS